MKRVSLVIASLMLLIMTYSSFQQKFSISKADYKVALEFVYLQLVLNLKPQWNLDWRKLNAICSDIDVNSYLHPDTILEDRYLFNFEMDYEDKQVFFRKIGFNYKRTPKQLTNDTYGRSSRFQGLQSSVWSYNDWFSYLTCAFEKKMRLPVPYSVGKSRFNIEQNALHKRLLKQGANEQCIEAAMMLNKGFSLDNPEECMQAMEILKNKQYFTPEIPMKYLQKSDFDQGTGIWPLLEKEAEGLLNQYQNGTLCVNNTFKPFQLQEFVTNPLLLNIPNNQGVLRGHMFVFRVFFLVTSSQPLIVYIYDSTSIYICVHPYNKSKFTHYTHFCHNKFANQYKEQQGMFGEQDIEFSKSRDLGITFKELTDMFIAQGVIPKGTTPQEFIYSKVEEKIGFYFTQVWKYYSDSRFGQWSAFDVIMNDKLDIRLLEMNVGYTVEEKYPERGQFLQTLQLHSVNLMLEYVRQRYLRIKQFLDTELLPAIKKSDHVKRLAEFKQMFKVAATDVVLEKEEIHHYWLMDLNRGMKKCLPFM